MARVYSRFSSVSGSEIPSRIQEDAAPENTNIRKLWNLVSKFTKDRKGLPTNFQDTSLAPFINFYFPDFSRNEYHRVNRLNYYVLFNQTPPRLCETEKTFSLYQSHAYIGYINLILCQRTALSIFISSENEKFDCTVNLLCLILTVLKCHFAGL